MVPQFLLLPGIVPAVHKDDLDNQRAREFVDRSELPGSTNIFDMGRTKSASVRRYEGIEAIRVSVNTIPVFASNAGAEI